MNLYNLNVGLAIPKGSTFQRTLRITLDIGLKICGLSIWWGTAPPYKSKRLKIKTVARVRSGHASK